ncbi:TM9S2-like protein [Mya arenaria]|uniref:Transmembrane 9 superfamily member n=1 Tax=Mya arenaria TaxID=6604 RepID=A0ABY7G499_MYAAR|nr:TM9S2-like protein [Mya arenaria]
MILRLALVGIIFCLSEAFYLPGLAPQTYCETNVENCKKDIPIYVNRLNSLETVIPYEYDKFDLCQDTSEEHAPVENLGQVVFGERIKKSPIMLEFKKNVECANNMPATWCYIVEDGSTYCSRGFPLGCFVDAKGKQKDSCVMSSKYSEKSTFYFFNHVDIHVRYHPGSGEEWGKTIPTGGRIISAKIVPKSIMNSLVIVLFLSGMVAMIMLRTLHKDIARYNQIDNSEEAQEEFGWKLVHGDAFRPPRKGMLLAILNGSGVQIFFMTLITLVFACLGFLSPANRGALMTCSLVLYVCLGTPAGYVSARLIVFAIFFILNLVLWIEGSSAAIPFTTLLALLALWFGISVPLTFVGAYFGFKKRPIEHPVRTNQIPRQIPDQTIYTKPIPGIVMGGVLPFGCIFIQLFFILNSIWSAQTYYMFGFLFLVFTILIITCSEATILLCYFHLCAEDYHWWWRSFLTSGFTAVYFFIYCIHYYVSKLELVGAASTLLYFGYMTIVVFLFFMLTGTIGFFACFWFVTKIYSVNPYEEAMDYHWWWRSFLTSGFTAVYFFIYCIHYYVSKLELVGAASTLLYIGYMTIVVFLFFMLTGTIGFFACFWFVTKIYSVPLKAGKNPYEEAMVYY